MGAKPQQTEVEFKIFDFFKTRQKNGRLFKPKRNNCNIMFAPLSQILVFSKKIYINDKPQNIFFYQTTFVVLEIPTRSKSTSNVDPQQKKSIPLFLQQFCIKQLLTFWEFLICTIQINVSPRPTTKRKNETITPFSFYTLMIVVVFFLLTFFSAHVASCVHYVLSSSYPHAIHDATCCVKMKVEPAEEPVVVRTRVSKRYLFN